MVCVRAWWCVCVCVSDDECHSVTQLFDVKRANVSCTIKTLIVLGVRLRNETVGFELFICSVKQGRVQLLDVYWILFFWCLVRADFKEHCYGVYQILQILLPFDILMKTKILLIIHRHHVPYRVTRAIMCLHKHTFFSLDNFDYYFLSTVNTCSMFVLCRSFRSFSSTQSMFPIVTPISRL